jgi:hypothetical protein
MRRSTVLSLPLQLVFSCLPQAHLSSLVKCNTLALYLATCYNFFTVSLLRNHNSNLCSDPDNKINV